ncbi:hypothetical protein ACJIZ3_011537 [Penstemon smallii]|uniref:Agenet domain-containing protein n=1 Tax=Penstemon smallii TaxID=265156 RepID=A0ABD3UMZ7_9LAMI
MVIRSSNGEDPFKSGASVEVSLEDEGFHGSWYAATVLRSHTKKTSKKPRLLLEFHTLCSSTSHGQPLREAVDVILIRPIPPREPHRRFCISEDVDAFHNDGWWEGTVTAVLDGGDRYSVFFRSSREQIDFSGSELRLHREWVYGVWVPPLEDDSKDEDTEMSSV